MEITNASVNHLALRILKHLPAGTKAAQILASHDQEIKDPKENAIMETLASFLPRRPAASLSRWMSSGNADYKKAGLSMPEDI